MTDPDLYRPPFLTQWAAPLSQNGVDDCRVCSALHLAAAGSLGDCITTPRGNVLQQRGLAKLAAKMRASLNPPDPTGGLSIEQSIQMLAWLNPAFVPARPSIEFDQLWNQLGEGYAFSVSGEASQITVDTPLKRTSGPHEWFVLRLSGDESKALIYDPFRNVGTDRRGEWAPRIVLRQFLYMVGTTVQYCLRVKVGAWREAALVRREMSADIATLRAERTALRQKLTECRRDLADCETSTPGCEEAAAAAREQLLDDLADWMTAQRGVA